MRPPFAERILGPRVSATDLVPTRAAPIANRTATTRIARAVAEAIFSKGGEAPPADRIEWVIAELFDLLARAGGRAGLVLRASLFIVSWLGPVLIGRAPGIARLPLALRVRALERLERSALAAPLTGVKAVLCILYYEHPDAAREVGIDGLCLVTPEGAR